MQNRTNEMINRLNYEAQYIEICEAKNRPVNWDRVITGHAQAFAAGIINGECENHSVLELMPHKNNETHFKIMVNALITRHRGKIKSPDSLTLKFTGDYISDACLETLAKAIIDPLFPHHIVIDLSEAGGFSDAGINALLYAMNTPGCNQTINIKFSPHPRMVKPEILDALQKKQLENQQSYHPPKKEKAKKSTLFSSVAKVKKTDEKKPKKQSLASALFGGKKSKTIKTEEKKRVTYTRHQSESKIKR